MRKFIIATACLGLIASAAFCQNAKVSIAPVQQTSNARYYCVKCKAFSNLPTTCTHCNVPMVKEGDYYCPKCFHSSAKQGNCPKKACKKEPMVHLEPIG